MTKYTEGWDQQLAKHLLTRHLQVSWPLRESPPHWMSATDEAKDAGISEGSWLRDPEYSGLTAGDLRTIAVVGAGASKPLPMADELLLELESSRGGTEREAALERLERVYDFDRNSFEARLAAMSLSPESLTSVRDAISARLNRRQPSLLTYEVLAHLLKHRFLDAIISFNFDELLDQSISDELGDSEVHRIVTERDCLHVQFDATAHDYLPLYIKVHGTASERDTLRFTQESYYWTPQEIVKGMGTLLDTDHCVLVNIGYQLANFDFQYMLRRPRRLSLYHMDPYRLSKQAKNQILSYRREERPAQKEKLKPVGCAPPSGTSERPEFLDEALALLTKALEAEATAPADKTDTGAQRAHWRAIDRHQAVVELLRGSDLDTPGHYAAYLKRRTIIELAFAVAKGRGVVSIEPLMHDRPGRTFEAYCRAARAANNPAEPWSVLCRAGGLARREDSPPDTYHVTSEVLEPIPKAGNSDEPDPWGVHRLREIDPIRLAGHVLKGLDPGRWPPEIADPDTWGKPPYKAVRKRWPEAIVFRDALERLIGDTEIELHATDDRICSKVFENPRTLVTLTGMQGWTRRLLGDRVYDELWVVAETGGWLAGCADIIQPQTQVRLITAFTSEPETFGRFGVFAERKMENCVDVSHVLLPWYRHNRHMTILRRRGEPIAAIHYARRLRTPLVTPVVVQSQADLKRVTHSFGLLWDEASRYVVQTRLDAGQTDNRSEQRGKHVGARPDGEKERGHVEQRGRLISEIQHERRASHR